MLISGYFKRCFTIVELLIVIAIIAILISLLNPTFEKITETASKAECLNRQKGFISTAHIISDDNDGFLPYSGTPHARAMRPGAYNMFIEYIGSPTAMICPNVNFEGKGNKAIKRNHSTIHIGYQYFGNNQGLIKNRRAKNPRRNYILPARVTDNPESTLVADDTGYSSSGLQQGGRAWVMAPHHVYDDQTEVPNGTTPLNVGLDGANVGLLDGSARWKDSYELVEYHNSLGSRHFGYW